MNGASPAQRKIVHVDLDAFFASVEQRDDPSLRGRPVVIGGSPEGRGVVSTASYEARRYGIHSAMPAARAKRLCPHAIFLRGNFRKYRTASKQMRAIFADYTDLIEPLSLDEAYLDVTENKAGLPYARQVAQEIRRRIQAELGLTASAGVASVKFVAKIASDHRKPNGLTVIPPHAVLDFLHPQPVRKLPGVGPATATRLHTLGLHTIGDVYRRDERDLRNRLGRRGTWLAQMARGQDPRRVVVSRERKSRGSERTFSEDVTQLDRLHEHTVEQIQGLCEGLQSAKQKARTITLKLRYADFRTITRSRTLPRATHSPAELLPIVEGLLANTEAGTTPVRLIGVSVSSLYSESPATHEQLPLPFAPLWSSG